MITVVFAQKGQNIPIVTQQMLGQMSEEHTKILAEEHKKELDKAIEETRVRPIKQVGNHLKDQIQVEKISENGMPGYGVGNIAVLNQKAPWWAWINFGRAFSGRTSPPVDEGSFTGTPIPNAGAFRSGLWQHKKQADGGRMYTLVPNKDIQPHNYIEKALGVMVSKAKSLLKF